MPKFTLESIQNDIASRRDIIAIITLCVLAAFYAIYLFSLPIQYNDTDLWYHLTGGRHLATEGALYNPYVNSYLSPAAAFTNYFWGFQLSMYLTWSIAGEFGLIAIKAMCFLATGFFVARIIVRDEPFRHTTFLQILVIAAALALLASRGFSLRPHLLSYMFIPVFIYVLTHRPGLYWLLPILTVVWANVHGVEWVVGGLICGAFFLQRVSDYWFSDEQDVASLKPTLWIIACLPALLVNPHHIGLLATPFLHDAGLKDFITELAPFSLPTTIELSQGISPNVLILFIAGLNLAGLISCVTNYKKHIAAILLALGGIVLLLTAKRFIWEWMLLSIPLMAAGLTYWRSPKISLQTTAALVCVLILLPLNFWSTLRTSWQHYPYHEQSLPFGTTEFIAASNLTGRYAIAPSYAGYAEFVLSPKVLVHMDMQFPPFTSMDYHEIATAMVTATGLTAYINKYRPGMIGAKKSNKNFPVSTAASMGYVPVFFDQKVVLFIDKTQHKDIAEKYELKVINPFAEDTFRLDQIETGILELKQMLLVADAPAMRLTLASFLLEVGQVQQALDLTEALLKENPLDGEYQYFYARAQHRAGNCAKAVVAFEQALIGVSDPVAMHLSAAECYFVLGELDAAYQHFNRAIKPYKDPAPNMLHYYQYAISAISAGDQDLARRIITMMQQSNPSSEMTRRASELLAGLEK